MIAIISFRKPAFLASTALCERFPIQTNSHSTLKTVLVNRIFRLHPYDTLPLAETATLMCYHPYRKIGSPPTNISLFTNVCLSSLFSTAPCCKRNETVVLFCHPEGWVFHGKDASSKGCTLKSDGDNICSVSVCFWALCSAIL